MVSISEQPDKKYCGTMWFYLFYFSLLILLRVGHSSVWPQFYLVILDLDEIEISMEGPLHKGASVKNSVHLNACILNVYAL